MIILGIDTSCDDTSVALYEPESNRVLAESISSRVELHARFGGVVPEIAARQHLEFLLPMIESIYEEASITDSKSATDLIAVTRGPGLIGGLLVGFSCAKALSLGWGVPFIGVNHIEGHLLSAALKYGSLPYPHIALVISGGHSELYRASSPLDYELLGETRDDAAGELLDKVGRLLDVPFPAGKTIDTWTVEAERFGPYPDFPRPLIGQDTLEFSFSGLKTAALYFLKSEKSRGILREAVGAEVMRAAVDCLLSKCLLALSKESLDALVISGGVAASNYLRRKAEDIAKREGIKLYFPDIRYCTDNAAMIALAGWHKFRKYGSDAYDLDCDAALSI